MINAQFIAENTLQPLHNLYSQGYFWQEVEHLLLTVEGLLYQMYINLGLARARHPMQQGDILLHHLHQDTVIGILLRRAQRTYEFGMIVATMIQAADFHLVGLQHLPFLE